MSEPIYKFAGWDKSFKERMQIYRQQAEAAGPRTEEPSGTPMTPDQLYAKLKAEQQARDRVAQSVAERVPTAPVNPFANQLASIKERRAHATHAEIPALDRAIRMYKQAAEKWEAEQAAAAARAEYDALPTIKLMREHAAAFERSPPPGSDEGAVALAIATAKSNLFSGDGTDQAKRYWADIAAIEAAAEQRQREQLGQSVYSVKDALTGLEQQKEALADTEARAEYARQQLGGNDGSQSSNA